MERQFAALDSLRAKLAPQEWPELQVVCVLKGDAKSRLATMVGGVTTPVLFDGQAKVFEKLYGASKKRSLFLFDEKGCLIEGGMEGDLDQRGDFTAIWHRVRELYRTH